MASCIQCGGGIPSGARFCPACGAPVEEYGLSRRVVTALFCDVVGSTAIAEAMDPEAFRSLMARYFEAVRDILLRHGATIGKFIGDAVSAVFGFPSTSEDDAFRALCAAEDMRAAVAQIPHPGFAVRIGINTGEIVASEVAGEQMVLGDVMNVAARLEQLAQAGEILISGHTYDCIAHAVEVEQLDAAQVKGRRGSLRIYKVNRVARDVPAIDRRLDRPLVGRSAELEALRQTYHSSIDQRLPRLALLVGEAGIGKSRLTQAFLDGVDAHIFTGRCASYGADAIAPAVAVVEAAASTAGGSEDRKTAFEHLLDGQDGAQAIATRLETLRDGSGSIPTEEIFWSVRRLLEAVARRRPVVMVLEDLHWAHQTILELVDHILTWGRDVPLMILGTARPDLLEREDWHPNETRSVITLRPLAPKDAANLVRDVLETDAPPGAVVEQVLDSAAGNPLFVEQFLSMLLDSGALSRTDGGWVWEPAAAGRVPASITALLNARLDKLPPSEQRLLATASVVGAEFSSASLDHLMADSGHDIAGALRRLLAKELIVSGRWDYPGFGTYQFRHALIRDAAYGTLTKQQRAELHEQVADHLVRNEPVESQATDETIGYHLEQAVIFRRTLGLAETETQDLAERACAALAAAARRAQSRQDTSSAIALYERALAMSPSNGGEQDRVLLDFGNALAAHGDVAKARSILDQVLASAEQRSDESLGWEALIARGEASIQSADSAETATLLHDVNRAIDFFTAAGDERALAHAWSFASHIHNFRGEAQLSMQAAEQAQRFAALVGDLETEASARFARRAAMAQGTTPVEEIIRLVREDAEWALRNENRRLAGMTLCSLGAQTARLGHFDEARGNVRRGRAILEDLGAGVALGFAGECLAKIERLAGNPADAVRAMQDSYDIVERLGATGWLASKAALLADALYELGDDEGALQQTQQSEALAVIDDLDAHVAWRRVRAKVFARSGEFEAARELLEEASQRVARADAAYLLADLLADEGEVLTLAGDLRNAVAALERVLGMLEKKGNVVGAAQVRARLDALQRRT